MNFPVLFRFIDNPSYLDRRQLGYNWMKTHNYDERWEVFRKSYNTFKVEYYIADDQSIYVKMEVPSNKRGNTYDVVIKFFTNSAVVRSDHSLRNYNIQIFSNNPVFGFIFGYANHKAGIVIPELATKLGNEILKTPAKKNNPREAMGIDHSFYIAAKWLLSNPRLMNKSYITDHAKPYKEKELVGKIRSLAEVMQDYADNTDSSGNKKSFNKDKSILTKAGEVLSDAKSKVGEIVDRTFKRTSDKHVIKPSKHVGGKNVKTKSAITRKKAKTKI